MHEVLVDPNVHTDMRMRIQEEVTGLLEHAHEHTYGADGRDRHAQRMAEHDHDVPAVLRAVLEDPNLHTDMRMRLVHDIQELLRTKR